MNSRDILHVGAHVVLPTENGPRHCEVTSIDDEGFGVKFFTPEGVGPFHAMLPHGEFPAGTIHRTLYVDEAAGEHESWWKTHPDVTGKYDG